MTEIIKVTIEGTSPLLFNRFRDVAIEGLARLGMAWQGKVTFIVILSMIIKVRHGEARLGKAWRGWAWRGEAISLAEL